MLRNMVRNILCIITLFISVSITSVSQKNVLKLPMTIETENGYGPFKGSWGRVGISDTNNIQNSWHTTYIRVKGFPNHWKNYRYGMFYTDFYQWTYQNYKQGKITEEDYLDLQKSW